MTALDTDPGQNMLAIDPGHAVWINGISQACGLDRPSLEYIQAVLMDRGYLRVWTLVWLPKDPDTGAGTSNFGVRIEQQRRFKCTVRGPGGHVILEHWAYFPGPDQIITLAMLAGFDW